MKKKVLIALICTIAIIGELFYCMIGFWLATTPGVLSQLPWRLYPGDNFKGSVTIRVDGEPVSLGDKLAVACIYESRDVEQDTAREGKDHRYDFSFPGGVYGVYTVETNINLSALQMPDGKPLPADMPSDLPIYLGIMNFNNWDNWSFDFDINLTQVNGEWLAQVKLDYWDVSESGQKVARDINRTIYISNGEVFSASLGG